MVVNLASPLRSHSFPVVRRARQSTEQSAQLLLSDLEVDRLKIAFDMHSAGGGSGPADGHPAGATEGDDNVVYVEDLRDLLRTLFIVS